MSPCSPHLEGTMSPMVVFCRCSSLWLLKRSWSKLPWSPHFCSVRIRNDAIVLCQSLLVAKTTSNNLFSDITPDNGLAEVIFLFHSPAFLLLHLQHYATVFKALWSWLKPTFPLNCKCAFIVFFKLMTVMLMTLSSVIYAVWQQFKHSSD